MAIMFVRVSTIRRAAGRSATAAAAYRSGALIKDDRTGRVFDYRKRKGVLATGMAGWQGKRADLWNAAERAEKRKDAVVAREVLIALPHELDARQREVLIRQFAGWLHNRHGCAVDWAIHSPDPHGDARAFHAHVLITTRSVGPDGHFGAKLILFDRKPASRAVMEELRRMWAKQAMTALQLAGRPSKLDHRSYHRQAAGTGMEPLLPQLRLGPAATQVARLGRPLALVAENARRRLVNEAAFRLRLGLHQTLRETVEAMSTHEQPQRVR